MKLHHFIQNIVTISRMADRYGQTWSFADIAPTPNFHMNPDNPDGVPLTQPGVNSPPTPPPKLTATSVRQEDHSVTTTTIRKRPSKLSE